MFKILHKFINKIKKVKNKYRYKIRFFRYKKRCKRSKQKEIIIFNTPVHGNIGDHAIIYAEEKLLNTLNKKAFEFPTYYFKECFEFMKRHIDHNAIICITGGGFIGSQWLNEEDLVMNVCKTFKEHKIIILPQTFYFKEDDEGKRELNKAKDVFGNVKDITIFAREEKTYNFVIENFLNAKVILVPDIVLSLDKYVFSNERNNVLLCFRDDAEKNFSYEEELEKILDKAKIKYDHTDTVERNAISEKEREKAIVNKLQEFSKYKIIITDRLHGMIFATLTNTPCIVFGNYNYKVKGVYNWIKEKDKNIIFENNFEDVEETLERLIISNKVNEKSINNYEAEFRELKELLKEI